MSGWDTVQRVTLAAPWEDTWLDIYVDPEVGAYIDMQAAAEAARRAPDEEHLDALVGSLAPLVAAHNLTARDGSEFAWTARGSGGRLIRLMAEAVLSVIKESEGGGSDDPLPSPRNRSERRRRPPSSPGRGSPANRSRSATASGDSPG